MRKIYQLVAVIALMLVQVSATYATDCTATISADGPLTFCKGEDVILTASPGASYIWSNGATTQSIKVNKPGTFYVQVTNASGCVATSSAATVTILSAPKPFVFNESICQFCEGGSVVLSTVAASSYLWTNGETTQAITVTTTGDYSVTITNANGCSNSSFSTHVTVYPLPEPTITPSGPTTICEDGSVILTASSASSYLWSTGETTQSITVSSAGIYSVTVTNEYGCEGSTQIEITEFDTPPATITADGPVVFCEGEDVILTANEGCAYLWSNGATTQSITVASSGNYYVTVTSCNGCVSTSSTLCVTVNPNPEPVVEVIGEHMICEGESVTLTTGIFASYLWSNGATTQSINVTESGNYSVTVTSANGCQGTSPAVCIVVNPNPEPIIEVIGGNVVCEGESITLTTGMYASYLWSTGETTQSITVTESGNYYVTVTSENGCMGTSAAVCITVNDAPPAEIDGPDAVTICPTTFITLYAETEDGLTYQWYRNGIIVPGSTQSSINTNIPGTYTVVTSNTTTGCSSTSDGVVVSNYAPVQVKLTRIGGGDLCCEGVVELQVKQVPGYTYQWYFNFTPIPGATGTSYFATESGVYRYAATSPDGCVKFSKKIAVTCGCEGKMAGENEITDPISFLNIYPNPSQGEMNIEFVIAQRNDVVITITDIQGKIVYSESIGEQEGYYTQSINLSNVPKGMYFVNVNSGTNSTVNKIIVN